MKQESWLSEFSNLSEFTRLYPSTQCDVSTGSGLQPHSLAETICNGSDLPQIIERLISPCPIMIVILMSNESAPPTKMTISF